MGNMEKIKEWIELAMKNQNVTDFEFEVRGGTNKDDGYLSNITFVKVVGKKASDHSEKHLDLVIKSSKPSEQFRKLAPMKETFEKEIYIYDQVIPAFQKFQHDKGIEKLLDITPFCFATQRTEKYEMLILEDLKSEGYKVCDRRKPMTFDHVKLVLEGYGRWHALSLALKNQKPEVFHNLIKDSINIFSHFVVKVGLLKCFFEKFEIARKAVKDAGEVNALEKLQFDQKAVECIMTDMFNKDTEYSVILHGDCWTNNLLFKYEENKPVDIKIIDWQMSGVASPVFDLAYFIYACCSTEDKDVEKLLKIYYNTLATTLQQLGSNPEKVFPYSKLIEHWKRFSKFGMVICNFILRFSLCDADEAPDLAEAAERDDDNFLDLFYFTIRDEDHYLNRVKNNLLHYAHNVV